MTREEAIKTLKEHKIMFQHDFGWDISTIKALDMAIKELEQQPCEDCISRQAVLEKAVYTETEEGWSGRTVDVKDIEALPSVTPKEKTGHWNIMSSEICKCSECKQFSNKVTKFCSNCGARMNDEVNKIDE